MTSPHVRLHTLINQTTACIDGIRVHEEKETRLINVLQNLRPGALRIHFEGRVQSERFLRGRLFDTRCQIYLECVDLRDMIDQLRERDLELADIFDYTLGQNIKFLMEELRSEEYYFNLTEESTLLNAQYVLENKWLMYNCSLKFREYTGLVARPGRIDPTQLSHGPELAEGFNYTQGQKINRLMEQLRLEEYHFNLTEESTLLNARHVFRNKWLIYKYSQKFSEVTGPITHPGGLDPAQR
ncbi:hypothetical protein BGX23_007751 [Mortierella sp. AD031]|nr:hypothetical protein BGX23_007751 [Mortierella sp. AD031]